VFHSACFALLYFIPLSSSIYSILNQLMRLNSFIFVNLYPLILYSGVCISMFPLCFFFFFFFFPLFFYFFASTTTTYSSSCSYFSSSFFRLLFRLTVQSFFSPLAPKLCESLLCGCEYQTILQISTPVPLVGKYFRDLFRCFILRHVSHTRSVLLTYYLHTTLVLLTCAYR